MIDTEQFDRTFSRMAIYLARGDYHLAQDVVSEMRMAVLNLPDDTAPGKCKIIAKYRAINYLRSKSVSDSYGERFLHCSWESMADSGFQFDLHGKYRVDTKNNDQTFMHGNLISRPDLDTDEILINAELQQAKEHFTEREWKVLVWFYYYGYTLDEIAAMLPIGCSAVSKILTICRQRLKDKG